MTAALRVSTPSLFAQQQQAPRVPSEEAPDTTRHAETLRVERKVGPDPSAGFLALRRQPFA
jgi:hypothetical protein